MERYYLNNLARFGLFAIAVLLFFSLVNLSVEYDGNVLNATNDEYSSKAYCLMEFNTGQILKEENSDVMLPMASITKTMTLLLAFEAIEDGRLNFDDMLVASENAAGMGGSQVFIDANSSYSVESLITSIIISSANDSSVVIAEELGGSEEGFVQLMNKKANQLGMTNTNYVNCTGLPANNHYSTARDLALVMKELLKHDQYYNFSNIWMQDFVHPSGRITQMSNTNKLIRNYKGCDAGKTGSTNEAGYCLSATAKRNDMRLIGVILGAQTSTIRFNECARLFDWGFANFESKCLVDSSKPLDIKAPIKKAIVNEIEIRPTKDYWDVVSKGNNTKKLVNYEFDAVKAPLSTGDNVGRVVITEDGIVLEEIDLVSNSDIPARNYGDSISEIVKNWKISK